MDLPLASIEDALSNEDMVVRATINDLPTPTFYRALISKDNNKQVLYAHIPSYEILNEIKKKQLEKVVLK